MILKRHFKVYMLLLLCVFYSIFANQSVASTEKNNLMVFVQDNCKYCIRTEKYLSTNPFNDEVNITYYNLRDKKSVNVLTSYINKLDIPKNLIGTPIFIIGDDYILGFDNNAKKKLKEIVRKWK
jgi:glutaredoxin